jgi:septal ring factor EnvC (AmiA/AmiB activator)
MLTTNTTTDVRQQLQDVEHRAAELTTELRQVESDRDTLIRQLADCEGCHDRHPVAVR